MSDWLGWHFLPEDRRLAHGDGREVRVGETLRVEWEPKLCAHGLHASKRAIDALRYQPGPVVCRVRLSGTIVEDGLEAVATERTVLAMADATRTLYEYAIWCAEGALRRTNVTDYRCWEALEAQQRWLDNEATDKAGALDAYSAWRNIVESIPVDPANPHDYARRDAYYAVWRAVAGYAKESAPEVAWDTAYNASWAVLTGKGLLDEHNAELERRLMALLEEGR